MPPKKTAVRPVKKQRTIAGYASLMTSAVRKISAWHPIIKQVLKQANYTCEECGKTAKDGIKLDVHHREPVEVYKEMKKLAIRLFPPVEMMDCLCSDCHKLAHRKDK
jgi:hypothetical protein